MHDREEERSSIRIRIETLPLVSTAAEASMLYVPVVPPPQTPSPRTRELAERLAQTIRDFEERHPSTSAAEIREAARLATRASGGTYLVPVATILGALTALGLGAFLFLAQGDGGGIPADWPVVAIGAAVLTLGALVAILARRAP